MLLSWAGVVGMILWGRSGTQDLARKGFEDALMSGGCRGKEQSVVGRDKGSRHGWKTWCFRGHRDWGERGFTGKQKAGVAVSCDCPHLRDSYGQRGPAWVLAGRCSSDSWTAMVNKRIPSSHCNVGWGVPICVFFYGTSILA